MTDPGFMSRLASGTKDVVLNKTADSVAGVLLGLLTAFRRDLYSLLEPLISHSLSQPELIQTLINILGLNLVLLTYLFLKRDGGLKLKYGIYWDKAKNPYCPLCKNPVFYGQYADKTGYHCKPCNHIFKLVDATGKTYLPNAVFEKIRLL